MEPLVSAAADDPPSCEHLHTLVDDVSSVSSCSVCCTKWIKPHLRTQAASFSATPSPQRTHHYRQLLQTPTAAKPWQNDLPRTSRPTRGPPPAAAFEQELSPVLSSSDNVARMSNPDHHTSTNHVTASPHPIPHTPSHPLEDLVSSTPPHEQPTRSAAAVAVVAAEPTKAEPSTSFTADTVEASSSSLTPTLDHPLVLAPSQESNTSSRLDPLIQLVDDYMVDTAEITAKEGTDGLGFEDMLLGYDTNLQRHVEDASSSTSLRDSELPYPTANSSSALLSSLPTDTEHSDESDTEHTAGYTDHDEDVHHQPLFTEEPVLEDSESDEGSLVRSVVEDHPLGDAPEEETTAPHLFVETTQSTEDVPESQITPKIMNVTINNNNETQNSEDVNNKNSVDDNAEETTASKRIDDNTNDHPVEKQKEERKADDATTTATIQEEETIQEEPISSDHDENGSKQSSSVNNNNPAATETVLVRKDTATTAASMEMNYSVPLTFDSSDETASGKDESAVMVLPPLLQPRLSDEQEPQEEEVSSGAEGVIGTSLMKRRPEPLDVPLPTRDSITATSSTVASNEEDNDHDDNAPISVKHLRKLFEKPTTPVTMLEIQKSHSHDSTDTGEVGGVPPVPLTPRRDASDAPLLSPFRRKQLALQHHPEDSVSELSFPTDQPFDVGGGMETFFRQQKLQKFAERQKLKETWIKYHCDKEEEVVVSLLAQPSAHAQIYAASDDIVTAGPSSAATPSHAASDVIATAAPDGMAAPPAATTDTTTKATDNPVVLVDSKAHDYRGFVFLVHNDHGLVLLHCTRKKNKPPHWQLPGGHVDDVEFMEAAKQSQDRQTQLILACKAGAARELYEETGMDFRSRLDRFEPAQLRSLKDLRDGKVINEFKDRLFFFLQVGDEDFPKTDAIHAPQGHVGSHLRLRLSHEHSGFTFEPEPSKAAELLQHHSGGKCSEALLMAMSKEKAPVVKEDIGNVNDILQPDAKAPSVVVHSVPSVGSGPKAPLPLPTEAGFISNAPLPLPTEADSTAQQIAVSDPLLDTTPQQPPQQQFFETGENLQAYESMDIAAMDIFPPKPKRKMGLLCCFGFEDCTDGK